jgi:hypothetical protein
VHGFGFSFLLQEQLQFAGDHLLLSLLAFNVGIELGQLVFIGVAVPVLVLLSQKLDTRLTAIVLSAFVAHSAWHWITERWEELAKQPWPEVDLLQAALWVLLAAALAVLARVTIVRRGDAEAGVKPH